VTGTRIEEGRTMVHARSDGAPASDYHGHPNYVGVWAALVALLGASLAIGWLGGRRLAVALVFGLATVKALLVLGNFMHLRWEPKLVWGIAGFGVLCLLFLYFGVRPDIVGGPQTLAR
jgi:caa(3)-type oxidase subunit IV